jgi:hypothetical protein
LESTSTTAANQQQDRQTRITDDKIDKAGPAAASANILWSLATDADPQIQSLPNLISCRRFGAATADASSIARRGVASLRSVHRNSVGAGIDRVRDIGARVIERHRRCLGGARQGDASHPSESRACNESSPCRVETAAKTQHMMIPSETDALGLRPRPA